MIGADDGSALRLFGADVGEPADTLTAASPPVSRWGKCNVRGVVIERHVWTPDGRKCERCGFVKP